MRLLPWIAILSLVALAPAPARGPSGFARAMARATEALAAGDLAAAREEIGRAQERDPRSVDAWALRARWAEAAADRDELVYALHRELQLRIAQRLPREATKALRERLAGIDPVAADLLGLEKTFLAELRPLAAKYEKEDRPHSAIRVHKEILALDPENLESQAAIERIAAAPDPSLAGDAKPRDLLADVSEEWIAGHDAEHATWKTHAVLERDNYVTHTDAGYEVLVRTAEAMEQMNAFYRVFFQYGTKEDGRAVSPIEIHIFRNRDEYLELGVGPPVEWSGGQFTGGAVETYIGEGGFEAMVGTLFHEAAHQFVSLATNASGWLNEGLASFFEGTRILANGTVLMNMPANHRLFELVERMERGWMADETDGIDPANASDSAPEKAPTFRIVLEDRYAWGPPWYAPTWGVVYFLYDYQDPFDGRFVYRRAFREFIDKSGGRTGEGAVENFEEVVLARPQPPTKGMELPADAKLALPETCAELDPVWKEWLTALRDEQSGRLAVQRPYLDWGRYAIRRGDFDDAAEHFEKGLVAAPDDPEVHEAFADLLVDRWQNEDRAVKLLLAAARLIERAAAPDADRIRRIERKIAKLDSHQQTLERVHERLAAAAAGLVDRYLAEGLDLMAMYVSWRMGTDFEMPGMFERFETAAFRSKKSLALWKLAYNEENLDGWADAGVEEFHPDGEVLRGEYGEFDEDDFSCRYLTLDEITSGDFSMEAEVQAEHGAVSFAGLVFGRKSANDCHALLLFPPGIDAAGEAKAGYVDLVTFYGGGSFKTWRHSTVREEQDPDRTVSERWRSLRVDVTGRLVDIWVGGEYVATQEFGTLDVLRGSFGLMIGTGKARFRNVRYLARAARDPGSLIEREIKMSDAAREGPAGGGAGSRSGSWLGEVPPFPVVSSWVQGRRESWEEAGAVPQLLVLWSVDQNELIGIDRWLAWLAESYAYSGLQIVSIGAFYDLERVADHLKGHPFPGAVGLDTPGGESLIGTTHEAYAIARFQLPRLLLLDIDGKVVWEGDPGFKKNVPWDPSLESFLQSPLEELVHQRKMRERAAWRTAWTETGRPALAAGRLAEAAPLLLQAREIGGEGDALVQEALARLAALEAAIDAIDATAGELASRGALGALETLLGWAETIGKPIDRRENKPLRDLLRAPASCRNPWPGRDSEWGLAFVDHPG
ncbi:MAG: tetratricopeptide repeat protein [Planctomycetota bacterium]